MEINIDFTNLEDLVKIMGASSVDWVSNVIVTHTETDWKIVLETKGLDVDIKDIEIQLNGLLQYRGEQILLYIRKEVSGNLPKFHFYDCMTLKTMKKMKRFYRYVITQRKDGRFIMNAKGRDNGHPKEQIEHLDVCRNCLDWYNKSYCKYYTVSTFDIVEFFEHFIKSPISQRPIISDTSFSDSNNQRKSINKYKKLIFDNTNKLQNSYSGGSLSDNSQTFITEFINSSKPISENYVEILPIITQATSVKLDIDESTQNFEDMF